MKDGVNGVVWGFVDLSMQISEVELIVSGIYLILKCREKV